MIGHIPKGARQGIVLAHGRGGTARDILSLIEHAALPEVAALAPEAPDNSWWPTSFLAPTEQIEPFVVSAVKVMQDAIHELEAAGLARDQIWVGGFSQGACLALETFARSHDGLAGVLAFSGGLIGNSDAGEAYPTLLGFPPKHFDYRPKTTGRAWISIHERDPHIPLRRVEDSVAALRAMGVSTEVELYPGAGHAVMRQDITALRKALNT